MICTDVGFDSHTAPRHSSSYAGRQRVESLTSHILADPQSTNATAPPRLPRHRRGKLDSENGSARSFVARSRARRARATAFVCREHHGNRHTMPTMFGPLASGRVYRSCPSVGSPPVTVRSEFPRARTRSRRSASSACLAAARWRSGRSRWLMSDSSRSRAARASTRSRSVWRSRARGAVA